MSMKKGSILIFTLWALIILAILSVILSSRASTDINLARHESMNTKAYYLAKAGAMKMLAELIKDAGENSHDSLDEDWNRDEDNPKELTLRGDRILYGASDEMAKLNLNSNFLTREHLIKLGIEESLAENILEYKNAKVGKGARAFEFIEELFLVKGLSPEAYSALKDLVTIYGDDASRVNINTASQEVLLAVIEDVTAANFIIDEKEEGRVFNNIDEVHDAILQSFGVEIDKNILDVRSDIFRIWTQVRLSESEEIAEEIETVVDRTTGRFLHWKEY